MMFERRLKVLLVLLALPAVVIVARLVQLQVVRAADYRAEAEQLLIKPPRYFACLRGPITDRRGTALAYDEPAWDITIHYGVLSDDVDYLRAQQRRLGLPLSRRGVSPELLAKVEESLGVVARMGRCTVADLHARGEEIVAQVLRVKESVERRRGVPTVIGEERMGHPLVRGLNQEQQVDARLALAAYPWIDVEPGHSRTYTGGEAFGHILGRIGPVDAAARERDPFADDELRAYLLRDMRGLSGVEALAEPILRGRRGKVQEDIEGRPIDEPTLPINGQPFRLSIDQRLQQALFNRLAAAVEQTAYRVGGSAVVLHAPTRQVLAMVSYPSIDPGLDYTDQLTRYADDERQPLLFRAAREYYAPGSIVKPMLLAGALTDRVVQPDTTFTCYGRLFQETEGWGCTGHHGTIGPVYAVQHSCNVYFYHVGQAMGFTRLRFWMESFGLGRATGAGLPGEKGGTLPEDTARGQARLTGIGQGQLTVTPLQAANMAADLATGYHAPVTLWMDEPSRRPPEPLPITREDWRLVRQGMYLAVNEPGGTAFGPQRGTLDDPDHVLLGKTGSAEVHGRTVETRFVCHFPDGRVEEIIARNRDELLQRYPADQRPRITGWRWYRRFPPDRTEPYTHAWFIGYLAPRDRPLEPVGSQDAALAIAVVLEFAGHGGEDAAPVARDMLRSALLAIQPPLSPAGEATDFSPERPPPHPEASS